MTPKPQLTFWQIWNICCGFFGIQFGYALQNANVSRIFQTLGADVDDIPALWIAAPLTGLIVQPVVGYLSDRTWTGLGRRKPYFLVGAIFATLALFLMPNSSALWMAAGMLWILDASINIATEPARAFVGDQLSPSQRPTGYAMQSFFIGVASVIASMLPWILTTLGVDNTALPGEIPLTVKYAFYFGGTMMLLAVCWTVFTTREYPPAVLNDFDDAGAVTNTRASGMLKTILRDLQDMPQTMRRLAAVQFFSWFALFAMWIYTTAVVTRIHFGATSTQSAAYNEGANWVGVLFAAYNGFAALAALIIPLLVRWFGTRVAYLVCVWAGAAGLLSFLVVDDPQLLLIGMAGIGFAWAAILSLPYALLSNSLPAAKMGAYMGIFNIFIVVPQLVAAGVLGPILNTFFDGEAVYALVIGAGCLFAAGLLVLRAEVPAASSAR